MASDASYRVMSNPTCNMSCSSRVCFFVTNSKVLYDSDAAARNGTLWRVGKAAHHLRAGHKRVSITKSKV